MAKTPKKRNPTAARRRTSVNKTGDAAALPTPVLKKAARKIESLIDGADSERVQLEAARHALALAGDRPAAAGGIQLVIVFQRSGPEDVGDPSTRAPHPELSSKERRAAQDEGWENGTSDTAAPEPTP
jgi:hypothetical protein